jgi:hypothetical protein
LMAMIILSMCWRDRKHSIWRHIRPFNLRAPSVCTATIETKTQKMEATAKYTRSEWWRESACSSPEGGGTKSNLKATPALPSISG